MLSTASASALVLVVASALAHLWDALQGGILGLGAIALALPAIWRYLIRPTRRIIKQVSQVHTVILGDDEKAIPSLTERLASQDSRLKIGDEDFERIEEKVDGVARDIGGDNGLLRRMTRLEKILDVLGTEERLEIRTVLRAAFERTEGKGRRAADRVQ